MILNCGFLGITAVHQVFNEVLEQYGVEVLVDQMEREPVAVIAVLFVEALESFGILAIAHSTDIVLSEVL